MEDRVRSLYLSLWVNQPMSQKTVRVKWDERGGILGTGFRFVDNVVWSPRDQDYIAGIYGDAAMERFTDLTRAKQERLDDGQTVEVPFTFLYPNPDDRGVMWVGDEEGKKQAHLRGAVMENRTCMKCGMPMDPSQQTCANGHDQPIPL